MAGPDDIPGSDLPGAELIDWNTFGQILEMDEDEAERDFSAGLVVNFFEQAESTFEQMDAALGTGNLEELSSLGHFLKGSSAALGLTNIQSSCEKIQHLGAGKDETGSSDADDPEGALKKIKSALDDARKEYTQIQVFMESFFQEALKRARTA